MQTEPALILLVEDNADHAELVMRYLAGHAVANRVVHLSNGQAAIDYLLRRGDFAEPRTDILPRLILLDLRLPRVDGLEVLRVLKSSESLRHIPVVIFTTSDTEQDTSSAYLNYANSYLVKPLESSEFRRLINDLGDYWLMHNRPAASYG